MKQYNIIFTQDSRILLSSKEYQNWKEIQNSFENYMASISFETLDEIADYLSGEYNLTEEMTRKIIEPLKGIENEVIEIDINRKST